MLGFTKIHCGQCGIKFLVPDYWHKTKTQDSTTWFCPNGHKQYYPQGETEEDKLRRELQRAQQRLAEKDDAVRRQRELREAAERSAAAYRGQVTKIKKRAGKGVCPCCNRHFTNLQRHMASQHPNFAESETHE